MKRTAKQIKAFELLQDNTTDYVGYGGAAGGGKSVLGCMWLICLGAEIPGLKFFIGRDSIKDVRASVLKTWTEVARSLDFNDYKFTDVGILFNNGTEVELLDLTFYPYKDPLYDRLGSKEYTSGWIEEAQQTHPLAFEVLKTRVGRWRNIFEANGEKYIIKSKILCTFNPKKNWVDSVFYRPFINNKESEEIKFIYALPADNPHLPSDYIKRLTELKDEATKQRLLYGNFDYDDDPNALLEFSDISEFWERRPNLSGLKYITADVARFGSDKAVIMVWHGFTIIEVITFDISSTTDIENAIYSLVRKHGIMTKNVVVDDDGVGGGIVDHIRCKGFVNNSSPIDAAYSNLKSECGYKLAESFRLLSISKQLDQQTRDAVTQELGQLKTFDSDKDGKLKLLPKDKIKENIGRSPDYLDNFIMRMYFEVKPVSKGIKTMRYK